MNGPSGIIRGDVFFFFGVGGLGRGGVLRQPLFVGKNVVAAQWFPCPKMVLEMRPMNVFDSKSRT